MSREKEKEEKIFRAIGDLPEDMVANAANYQLPERKERHYEKLVQMGKGFVCAACAALVVFGLIPWIYSNYSGSDRTRTDKVMVEEQESGVAADTKTEERKEEKLYLWSEAGIEYADAELKGAEDNKEKVSTKFGEKKESAAKEMKEGKTVRLYARDVPAEKESEEIKKVLPLRIGKSDDGITYMICSEISNCSVFSVISNGVTKQIDSANAECIGGDRLELNTFDRSAASWSKNPAPEWDGKDISIIDIIDITGKKEGEAYDFGKIVIGKKGENYYGLLQKKYD